MRLLLVDDHAMVREGLRRVLSGPGPGWTISECGSAEEALQRLQREPFDLVITDLSMPGLGGLALLQQLQQAHPGLPVLVLSMHAETAYARRAFEAGARGYVAKDRSAEELVQAVRRVAEGGVYISASLAEQLVPGWGAGIGPGGAGGSPGAALTAREREVMRRLVDGQRPTDIAASMQLSVKTVSTHKTRLLAKLGLPSLAALIRHAMDDRP
ncbi:MAG: response regulator transcription factor [Rubrivivax sp.]